MVECDFFGKFLPLYSFMCLVSAKLNKYVEEKCYIHSYQDKKKFQMFSAIFIHLPFGIISHIKEGKESKKGGKISHVK